MPASSKGGHGCERSSQGFAGEHIVVRSVLMSMKLSSRGQGHGGDAGSAEAWPSFCPRRGARGSTTDADHLTAAPLLHMFMCLCVSVRSRLMASASAAKWLSRFVFLSLNNSPSVKGRCLAQCCISSALYLVALPSWASIDQREQLRYCAWTLCRVFITIKMTLR